MDSCRLRPGRCALFAILPLSACVVSAPESRVPTQSHRYEIAIDQRRPNQAEVRLHLPGGADRLVPARDGDGTAIDGITCDDGRALVRSESGWRVPDGCTRVSWRVRFDDMDAQGIDASLPIAAFSPRHAFWLLPERDGLLRASDAGGSVAVRLRLADGSTWGRRYLFPSDTQPPFYAVIGADPTTRYSREGFTLHVHGDAPAFAWMASIHGHVLAAWARWRRDLVSGSAPAAIRWAWVPPRADLQPGYNASAGAEAIVSQIRLREGDPDAEAKARAVIAASAAHEGFHSITGAAGQAWPAWVNESLANHFAIEAARRFLPPSDRRFLERLYVDPPVRAPLLEAQARYAAGDGEQAQVFYIHGARFWREVERVLASPASPSGRLAALIKRSNNFAGVNLNDAAALAAFLDRHSDGRAGPIVRCFLLGQGCSS